MTKIVESKLELPWAVPKLKGFEGNAPGLYFWYYLSRVEAEKTRAYLARKGKFTGAVEFRPGECYQLGGIL